MFDDGEAIPRREFGPVRPATDLDIVPPGSVNVFQSFADIIISPEKQSIVQDYRSRMKFLLETSLQEQD